MLAVAVAGLLSLFGILFSANFLGPLAEPLFVLPVLAFSIALTIFGMLRRKAIQILLVTAGGSLSYAGMSNMLGVQAMRGMSSEAVYVAWAGIILVASSFVVHRFSSYRTAVIGIKTGGQSSSMSSVDKPLASFILSLIAGLFFIAGSLLGGSIGIFGGFGMVSYITAMPRMTVMSSTMDQMTQAMHMSMAYHTILFSLGLLSGALVLVGALMLYLRPEDHATWGAIVLAFSTVGMIAAMGGFLVGLILGILGGALAIAWKPTVRF